MNKLQKQIEDNHGRGITNFLELNFCHDLIEINFEEINFKKAKKITLKEKLNLMVFQS